MTERVIDPAALVLLQGLEPDAEQLREDEAALVRAARAGNRGAFGDLYERYARVVHGIMLAHAPAQVADDLVQDVFERALSNIGGLRDVNTFAGWLIAITRNRVRDHFRRNMASEELPEVAVPANAQPRAEAAAALEAIRRLPEAYRETLMLRLVEGMTGPEIAARVGITPDSVRVNLHRGMKMLREALNP
ncbi:MAG: sigma-70 family RNA polymerase sigma factor [Acidobacteria bacterium]|nr:sigma-70 family RNA polymerase sigma factor [Acidobacteriota bacterium]